MLNAGDRIELTVEKPAAGGRMLARHDGRIVFVHGAIPGERVRARIERVERQLAFAATVEILEASPDRREPRVDLACGSSYAHIQYARQLALKSAVIQETFARLGRIDLADGVTVQPSPEHGYRLRARFHVRDPHRAEKLWFGFYREGTHELCDARATGHLLDESVSAVEAAVTAAVALAPVSSVQLSETIAADQRALHFEAAGDAVVSSRALESAMRAGQMRGCSASSSGRTIAVGTPAVEDPLIVLTRGRAGSGMLQRHAASFFQANRFLVPDLVATIVDAVRPDGDVVDLYAGVGLFSVALAQSGRERITAVEGDRTSAADLAQNAAACGASVRVVASSVEDYLAGTRTAADTIIVDPPRTGISRAAMTAVVARGARRVIYVSCDPPTMARDARRLLDGGYRLEGLRAFDLFPNTPHVESVGIFDAAGG